MSEFDFQLGTTSPIESTIEGATPNAAATRPLQS